MSNYGFIYYATNPSMPGLIKVGYTSKHPRLRAEELSRTTSCPVPFRILAFFDVQEGPYAEKQIHDFLSEYRETNRREFFRAPMAVLREVARMWIDLSEGCAYTYVLDQLADDEEFSEIKDWMGAQDGR